MHPPDFKEAIRFHVDRNPTLFGSLWRVRNVLGPATRQGIGGQLATTYIRALVPRRVGSAVWPVRRETLS